MCIARRMKTPRGRGKAHWWWNVRLTSLQAHHIVEASVLVDIVDMKAYIGHAQSVLLLSRELLVGTYPGLNSDALRETMLVAFLGPLGAVLALISYPLTAVIFIRLRPSI